MEYDRLIGEWVTAGRPSSVATASDIAIAELCRRYKVFIEHYYVSGGSVANIKTAIRTLREIYGNTLAAEFGPLALKAIRQRFVDAGNSRTYYNRLTEFNPPHVQVGIVGAIGPRRHVAGIDDGIRTTLWSH